MNIVIKVLAKIHCVRVVGGRELMRNAISLAYDYAASRLFYSDIQRGAIHSVHFNGSNHEVLLDREYCALAFYYYYARQVVSGGNLEYRTLYYFTLC